MKTAFYFVVQLTVTFFVALFLNFILNNFLILENGDVQFGSILSIDGKNYFPITVSNFENKSLEQVKLAIPSYVNEQDIISSHPLKIEIDQNTIGNNKEKYAIFSNFKPLRITQLLVPIQSEKDTNYFEVLNPNEKHLGVIASIFTKTAKQKVFLETLKDTFFYIIVFAALYAFMVWHQEVRFKEKQKLYSEAKSECDSITKKLEYVEKEANEIRSKCGKCRILLLNKIRDYIAENDFWRDTVRAILIERISDKKKADELIDTVTERLGTYSTRSQNSKREIAQIDYLVKASEENSISHTSKR